MDAAKNIHTPTPASAISGNGAPTRKSVPATPAPAIAPAASAAIEYRVSFGECLVISLPHEGKSPGHGARGYRVRTGRTSGRGGRELRGRTIVVVRRSSMYGLRTSPSSIGSATLTS